MLVLNAVVNTHDKKYGKRKGNQNAHIERMGCYIHDNLAQDGKNADTQEIMHPIMCITTPFGNHIGKDGKREPANDTKRRIVV